MITSAKGFYKPHKKQRAAHDAKETNILFGGAVGGGKTAWLVNEAICHCLEYPGARIYLARQALTSFKKSTLLTLCEFMPFDLLKQWNKGDHVFIFNNGSRLYYGGLGDSFADIQKLKSMELSAVGIDQAEETTEDFFFMLSSRIRLKDFPHKFWLTANPSPNWIKMRFLESDLEDHKFIPALPSDNPFLESDYIEKLRKILPEELISAWIQGNWDAIAEENAVFNYQDIIAAMKRETIEDIDSECLGVDPARFGRDETVIARKRGNELFFERIMSKKSTMETTGVVIQVAGNSNIEIKLDSIGIGAGIADRLIEQDYNLIEVVGSASPENKKLYKNLRAENYFNFKNMLPKLKIPEDDKLLAQMMAVRYRIFSDGLLLIESKDEMKRRGIGSPDRLDALVIACSGGSSESKGVFIFTDTNVDDLINHFGPGGQERDYESYEDWREKTRWPK